MIYEDFDQKTELMYARRDEFVEALKTIEGTVIHGFEHKVSDNGDMYACTGVGGGRLFSRPGAAYRQRCL